MTGGGILFHATSVAIGGRAVLLRGPSGSGKSDLALRLIDAGARLVADDQSEVRRDGEALFVRCPAPIAGLIEVRGVGLVKVDSVPTARLALIADLVAPQHTERLPEPRNATILGLAIPLVAIAPFEASAPIKLRLALGAAGGSGTPAG
ncbi:MAG TPA: serine/threonine protein kinase [Stellaceae bacterium]|nr:serine/threonine protein kinase [Stellaceae bacterium]